jgi:hypothetical protein
VPVRRPRVRTADGTAELPVATDEQFTRTELLGQLALERMLARLSTRDYRVGLEPVGTAVTERARATSRSAVSRRFVARTRRRWPSCWPRPTGCCRGPGGPWGRQAAGDQGGDLPRLGAQYGGMKADDVRRLKELEAENDRLKRIVADKELQSEALKELGRGNW